LDWKNAADFEVVPEPGSNIPPTGRYFTGFTYYQYQHLYLNVYLKREVPLSSPPQPVAYRFAPRFAVAGCDHHYSPRFGMEEMEK
jgi:hypothetical protein